MNNSHATCTKLYNQLRHIMPIFVCLCVLWYKQSRKFAILRMSVAQLYLLEMLSVSLL
jgi:hypothetical protein